jgi:predicted XRE-type DNA-binding protein
MTQTSKRRARTKKGAASPPRGATHSPKRRGSSPNALRSSTHVTPSGGNVFSDLGFAPEEAENLKIRARLMSELSDVIETRKLTQVQAAELFGVAQPRISDLRRGKIDRFTIDTLVNMLAHAGIRLRLQLSSAA